MKQNFDWIEKQIRILCSEMPINENIVCLLKYGSIKQKEDFNAKHSDLDFHLVLREINSDTLKQIKYIFGFSESIDLSIHSLDEIVQNEKVVFQNGNQGVYFMYVLCAAEVVVGKNIYLDLVDKIEEEDIRKSILEKIRYYLWSLRKNYISNLDRNFFQKYLTRILKDILILDGTINYSNISALNGRQILNLYIEQQKEFLTKEQIGLLNLIPNILQTKEEEIEDLLILFQEIINNTVWKKLN